MNSHEETDTSKSELEEDVSEVYVWPLMVIVANVPFQCKYGAVEFKNELINKGFNPVKVHPLWDSKGCLGYAIVEFRYDFLGFTDALRFEKCYASNCQGKRNFVSDGEKGDKVYYWVAMEDDYNSEGVIGDFLHDHGDLKTLEQYEELQRMRDSCYISSLADEIKRQNSLIKEIETNYKETSILQYNSMNEKDEILRSFNKEKQKIEEEERCQLAKISENHERLKVELEIERERLEKREKELKNREANNEQERLTLLYEQQQKGMKRLREPELDSKAFVAAAKRRYLEEEADEKAVELCSIWADYLRDPSWYPFMVVADNGDGEKIMIDEEDEKVKKLRDECGEEGYKAVITELIKLNHTEDLTATLNEGISYIVKEYWSSKKMRFDFQAQRDPTE